MINKYVSIIEYKVLIKIHVHHTMAVWWQLLDLFNISKEYVEDIEDIEDIEDVEDIEDIEDVEDGIDCV